MTDKVKARLIELVEKVEELMEETQKETGAFKYDFAYEEVIALLQAS